MDEELAQKWVKGTIKGELDKRGLTYADLCQRLQIIGIEENERNLRNKVARGTFSATFFMQCLQAIGVYELRVDILPRAELDRLRDAVEPGWRNTSSEMDDVLNQIREMLGPDHKSPREIQEEIMAEILKSKKKK